MFTKEEYEKNRPLLQEIKKQVQQDSYRLGFHIMPPTGWLNDPNGLCQFHGCYHIYYQYTPHTPTWGIKLWGHYTTKDWISYQEEEPFLFPDSPYDQDGVYSGSAFVENDQIHFFYTGNVKYIDKAYDYILEGREQNTIHVLSKDGFHYEEKQVLLKNEEYPNDMSLHVRDPKIYKKDGIYYMVIGARSRQDKGCALVYVSDDLSAWTYHMRIETETPFGYMWECPDLFDLDNESFLICCPQGVPQKGDDYANVYQCGYFKIQLDLIAKTYQLSPFVELDRGFDIYAPQSFEDEQGRRILKAWMGIPDAPYHNEETIKHGWQHALTMPRVLRVEGNRIVQKPLPELQKLHRNAFDFQAIDHTMLDVSSLYECSLVFKTCVNFRMKLREGVYVTYENRILSFQIQTGGCGRTSRQLPVEDMQQLQIFVDTSCVEIFINGGKEVFTSRYYTKDITKLDINGTFEVSGTIYELQPFFIQELSEK